MDYSSKKVIKLLEWLLDVKGKIKSNYFNDYS